MQDHLGSNRVSFRMATDSTLNLSSVQNYYPFGLAMGDSTINYSVLPESQYKYNSKELQPELDLDTYDFGARHYDPVLGRWMQLDPMALLSDDLSPYNYVENNPMNMVDPDGMQPGIAGPESGYGPSGLHTGAEQAGSGGGGFGWDGLISGGAQFFKANSAFSYQKTTIQDWSNGIGGAQGNGAVRSSIPQPRQPFERYTGPNADQREFVDQVTNSIVKHYAQTHARSIHVGKYNPNTGMTQGSGAVTELIPANGIIEAGITLLPGGVEAEAAAGAGEGFESFSAFKRAYGPAGEGQAWHHIVEQHAENIVNFGPKAIHNTENIIRIEHGAGSIHSQITGHYNSLIPGTKVIVRDYVKSLSFEEQYLYGIKTLTKFGKIP